MREEETMNKYIVPYYGSGWNRERMQFSRVKSFGELERAVQFAEDNLPTFIMQRLPLPKEETAGEKKYIVLVEYTYGTMTMGDFGTATGYEAVRCKKSELEAMTHKLANREGFQKIYRGVEVDFI